MTLPDRLLAAKGPSRDIADQFDALADRAAVQFPEQLEIQHAACALLGRWALNNRALIAAALRAAISAGGE